MAKSGKRTEVKTLSLVDGDLICYAINEDKMKRLEQARSDMWSDKAAWSAAASTLSAFFGLLGCTPYSWAWQASFAIFSASFVATILMGIVAYRAGRKQSDVLAEIRAQKTPPLPTQPDTKPAQAASTAKAKT
ncbi:MAG: hypothetical protein M5U25_17105 [Planctomycetota bacterium]|nr:hypothetical protein [Planctomycetota bacterium]